MLKVTKKVQRTDISDTELLTCFTKYQEKTADLIEAQSIVRECQYAISDEKKRMKEICIDKGYTDLLSIDMKQVAKYVE